MKERNLFQVKSIASDKKQKDHVQSYNNQFPAAEAGTQSLGFCRGVKGRQEGRRSCTVKDFQAGWAICLCLQMAEAAATKGQQNVTRTRPYSGCGHVPVTGRGTTPRWKNTRCRSSLSLSVSHSLCLSLVWANTARLSHVRALDACPPAAGGTFHKKENPSSVRVKLHFLPRGSPSSRVGVGVYV